MLSTQFYRWEFGGSRGGRGFPDTWGPPTENIRHGGCLYPWCWGTTFRPQRMFTRDLGAGEQTLRGESSWQTHPWAPRELDFQTQVRRLSGTTWTGRSKSHQSMSYYITISFPWPTTGQALGNADCMTSKESWELADILSWPLPSEWIRCLWKKRSLVQKVTLSSLGKRLKFGGRKIWVQISSLSLTAMWSDANPITSLSLTFLENIWAPQSRAAFSDHTDKHHKDKHLTLPFVENYNK